MPLTELRIEGLRTIEKIRLKLDGLTVLIGANGSGKSSILEACELLRRSTSATFLDEVYRIHGGMPALLRQGTKRVKIGVTLTLSDTERSINYAEDFIKDYVEDIIYDLSLVPMGSYIELEETLSVSFRKDKQVDLLKLKPVKRGKKIVSKFPIISINRRGTQYWVDDGHKATYEQCAIVIGSG